MPLFAPGAGSCLLTTITTSFACGRSLPASCRSGRPTSGVTTGWATTRSWAGCLVSLLYAAGATPVRNNWLFFGSCAGSPTFPDITQNLEEILVGARSMILATAQIEGAAFDQGLDALKEWSNRPDAAFWFAVCWAEGRRP